jgi:DNA-binding transcriptional MerR regulator/methylmalonyl-CoA mutase cobalamin-binding subunit
MENRKKYNIKAVSKLTGLSDHTIRAWERRYSALTPERTETNRRLYSDEEIEKLSLLADAVKSGYTISGIANYNVSELQELIKKKYNTSAQSKIIIENSFSELIEQSLKYIKEFQRENFEKILMQVSINFSRQKMLVGFLIPLLHQIGELWANGNMRIVHEHFAASVLRTFLGSLLEGNISPNDAPKIITTTPEGFLHELGALLAAIYAIDFGWNAIFLGPNLPAEEISAAVIINKANVLLLSLVYPKDEPSFVNQLRKLRKYLGENFPIILTGQAASSYKTFNDEVGVYFINKITELNGILEKIRG